jgi:molybdenum cofactor cytidylyltransferase
MNGRASSRPAAVVLAAGRASRFGGHKVTAELDGKPLLQHVLDAVADAAITDVVVITPPAVDRGDPLDEAIAWRTERRVANPRPEDGLASSLKIGLAAVPEHSGAAVVLLADQPRVRSIVIRRLVEAWRSGAG